MQKLKTNLLHQWMNHSDQNGNRLTSTETSLLFHLALHQDETGLVTGVHNKEVTHKYQALNAKSSFYKAISSLAEKQLILVEKNHASDMDILLLGNDFTTPYEGGYVSLHQPIFHAPVFYDLTGRNQLLLTELVRRANLKTALANKELQEKREATNSYVKDNYEHQHYKRTSEDLVKDLQALFRTKEENTLADRTIYYLLKQIKETMQDFITTSFVRGTFSFFLQKKETMQKSVKKFFGEYKLSILERRLKLVIPKHTSDAHKNTISLFTQYDKKMSDIPEYNGYNLIESILSRLYPTKKRATKAKVSTRLLHGELKKELKQLNPAFS